MKKKPLKYQIQAFRRINNLNGRAFIAQDMGLGKTFQACHWTHFMQDDCLPTLVICPSAVKYQWAAEVRDELGFSAYICEKRKPPAKRGTTRKLRLQLEAADVVIINYEILKLWTPVLRKLGCRLVIIDEAHRIKNEKSIAFRSVRKICLKKSKSRWVPATDYVLALSGTPMISRPIELWTSLHVLRPDLWQTRSDYAWRYCNPQLTIRGWDFRGSNRRPELRRLLKKHVMIRQTKRGVLKHLPRKVRNVIPLGMEHPEQYKAAEQDFIGWLGATDPSKVKKAKKALQIQRMLALKRLAATEKMPAAREWLEEWLRQNPNEKLAIFGIHHAILQPLYEYFEKAGYHPALYHGKRTKKQKQIALKNFTTTKRCRLFIANSISAGTGIDGLQRVCSNMAIIELGWTPGEHNQLEDRLLRIGQDNHVFCWYLIAYGTIEEDTAELIHKKQKLLDSIIDGKRTVAPDQDIFRELARKAELRKAE
jgi:SWI/SNF-related matrix-associated actin-dependent regulator 1 of chromatin subfamily A